MKLVEIHFSEMCISVNRMVSNECTLQAAVSVDLGNGRRSNRVIVKGAANVTIYPSCVDKVMCG